MGRLRDTAIITLLTLVTLEVTARVALSLDPVLERLDGRGDVASRIARLTWAARRAGPGRDPMQSAGPVPWEHHPTRGWVSKPGHWGDEERPVTVGPRHLRTLTPIDDLPTRPRTLVLGDSFTFGDEVGDTETWAWLLGQDRPDLEIVNGGTLGYDHGQALLFLEEEGLALQPDVVVLGFVGCDVLRNTERFNAWQKPRFVLEDGELTLPGVPLPEPAALFPGPLHPRLGDVAALWRAWLAGPPSFEEVDALTQALVGRLIARTREAGAVPVLAYLPIMGEFEGLGPGDRDAFRERSRLDVFTSICEAHPEAVCLDVIDPFLEAESKGVPLIRTAHWTPAGHVLIAETLSPALVAAGVWPERAADPAPRSPGSPPR